MEYKLPPLPEPAYTVLANNIEYANYAQSQVIEYAEQAVAPLLAKIERLEKLHAVHPNVGLQQMKAQMGAGSFDAYVQSIVTGRP